MLRRPALVALVLVAQVWPAALADDFEIKLPNVFPQKSGGGSTAQAHSDFALHRVDGLDPTNTTAVQQAVLDIRDYEVDYVTGVRDALVGASTLSALVTTAHDQAHAGPALAVGERTNLTVARGPTGLGDAVVALARELGDPLTVSGELQVRSRAANVPASVAQAGAVLTFATIDAIHYLDAAFRDVDPQDAARLEGNESLATFLHRRGVVEEDAAGNRSVVFGPNETAVLAAAANMTAAVNRTELYQALDVIAQAVDEVLTSSLPLSLPGEIIVPRCSNDPVVFADMDCLVVIGGTDPTAFMPMDLPGGYERNVVLLELGGADLYAHRAGGGQAQLGTCTPACKPAQLLVDIGNGHDQYAKCGLPGSLVNNGGAAHGAGRYGVGLLYDAGGDDAYCAKSNSAGSSIYAQGAAFYGAGMLVDATGNDTYVGLDINKGQYAHVQGAAWGGGLGLLRDAGGVDHYYLNATDPSSPTEIGGAQGFAHEGGVAYLLDLGTSDDHFDGGQTLVQGAAEGGGFAFFHDAGGANAFAVRSLRGCAAFLSDALDACRAPGIVPVAGWSQGYAGVASFAAFVGGTGDDTYAVHRWASEPSDETLEFQGRRLAGASESRAVGIFYEPGGDDTYGLDGDSLAATADGLAVFLDAGGTDTYLCPVNTCFAHGGPGVAVFYDGVSSGDDFPEGRDWAVPWTNGDFLSGEVGIGLHLEGDA